MKNRILLLSVLFSVCLLITSCSSTQNRGEDGQVELSYTKSDAIIQLGSDMLSESGFELDANLLAVALRDSYVAYSDYVPLYYDYRGQYLSDIASCVLTLIDSAYPVLEDSIKVLSANPDKYFMDDVSLTDDLYASSFDVLSDTLFNKLSDSMEAHRAFSPSQEEFLAIKAVYANLSTIGLEYSLPEPEMIDFKTVSDISTEAFFTYLLERESYLKNRIYDESSPYSYFWEGKNE